MSGIKINFTPGMFMVPDSFVDRFIKDTNASFIKLYIYILRHSSDAELLTMEKISDDTGLLQSDVLSGLKYWQSCGVLSYGSSEGKSFINISSSYAEPSGKPNCAKEEAVQSSKAKSSSEKKLPANSVASTYNSSDVVRTVAEDKSLKHMFSLIQQMLNKSLSVNDYKVIYSFVDYLKLPEQVILLLFEHCISIGKTSMRYIEAVAYSWADKGITDVKSAENYVNEMSEKQSVFKKYKRKFKITGREFTDTEEQYIYSWVHEFRAPEELIMRALDKSVMNTGNVNVLYMDAVIRGELEEPASQSEKAEKTAKSPKPSNVKKSNFRNYPDSYEISDAEKQMIDKMMAEYNGGALNADNE